MQSGERERMKLLFNIRKAQCFLLVGVRVVVMISNLKIERSGFLIL